jgi:hypothetical protein
MKQIGHKSWSNYWVKLRFNWLISKSEDGANMRSKSEEFDLMCSKTKRPCLILILDNALQVRKPCSIKVLIPTISTNVHES